MRGFFSLVAAFAVFYGSARAEPANSPLPLICIDAGHGGRSQGALGAQAQLEKTITLQIAQQLRAELERTHRFRTMMTREDDLDVGLSQRIKAANQNQADIFISVHCNATPEAYSAPRIRGVETYFLSAEATGNQAQRVAARENADAASRETPGDALANILNDLAQTEAHRHASTLAYAVHQQLVKNLKAVDRGIHQAPFIVLMGAQMPAILVEVGFITHPVEARELSRPARQTEIAKALAGGLSAFLAQITRTSKTSGVPSALAH